MELSLPLSVEEVIEGTMGINSNSAQGSDGLSSTFFQKF